MDLFESLRSALNHMDPRLANYALFAFIGAGARHLAGMVFGFARRRRRR